jgi:hypothetical protein
MKLFHRTKGSTSVLGKSVYTGKMNTDIPIQPGLRLHAGTGETIFRPGTFQLLQLIDETGSVQLAGPGGVGKSP